LSARTVGQYAGVDPTGLARFESARYRPSRETASRLYAFYEGIVPLGMIYDPEHEIYAGYWTESRKRKLRALGRWALGRSLQPDS